MLRRKGRDLRDPRPHAPQRRRSDDRLGRLALEVPGVEHDAMGGCPRVSGDDVGAGEDLNMPGATADLERDMLRVFRPKTGRTDTFPLTPTVGNALMDYLLKVRPPECSTRRQAGPTSEPPKDGATTTGIPDATSRRRTTGSGPSERTGGEP